jgi:hypothetical protein
MSATYSDLTCAFPNSLDPNLTFSDVTSANKDLVNQYYTYKESGDDSSAIDILTQHPDLKTTIITHETFQLLYDMCIAQERFYTSDFRTTVTTLVHNKGEFDNAVQYSMFDLVVYKYKAYLCNSSDVPIGTLPTTDSWDRITFQGPSGTGMAFFVTWDSAHDYVVQDCVPYSNRLYVCIQANYGKQPDISPDYWKSVVFNPKQILYSVNQPENQAEGDIWLEKEDSGHITVHIKNDASTYDNLYPNDIYKAGISTLHHVNLLASGWQGSTPPFSYNINLVGITSTSLQQILPETNMTDEQENTLIDLNLREGVQSNNVFSILTYGEKPAIDIPIRVIIRGDL